MESLGFGLNGLGLGVLRLGKVLFGLSEFRVFKGLRKGIQKVR